jgi:hypothetical protein
MRASGSCPTYSGHSKSRAGAFLIVADCSAYGAISWCLVVVRAKAGAATTVVKAIAVMIVFILSLHVVNADAMNWCK